MYEITAREICWNYFNLSSWWQCQKEGGIFCVTGWVCLYKPLPTTRTALT